jgi:hypothetical protein
MMDTTLHYTKLLILFTATLNKLSSGFTPS